MALNLVRNSKVYFTSNVNAAGKVGTSGFTAANTQEIQVLDGFTFSQNTTADVVTISEAGVAPVRGQRSFNTALAPVDFSMSTYLRPKYTASAITAEESVLWNALFNVEAVSAGITIGGTPTYTYAYVAGTGIGTLTVALTSGTLASAVAVGSVVTLGGFTAVTGGALTSFNAPAVLKSYKIGGAAVTTGTVPTTGLTELVFEYVNPTITASSSITNTTPKLYKSAWAPVVAGHSLVTAAASNTNQLQKFGMIFIVDNVTYIVDNCALTQVTIDFGLDAIATAAWTGQGTALRQSDTLTLTDATAKVTDSPFITNKLSTVTMSTVKALGDSTAGTAYTIALTGGSITINNNITYITPANLGTVNVPAVYYTGTRSITGTMNAYLKTGSGVGSTGQLLADMLKDATTAIEPMGAISIAVGGSGNATRVVFDMPSVTFTIPTVDVQQVVSTAINFTAAGSTAGATAADAVFALDKVNDIAIRYYSATV